ncbi:MAG: hypothetical protein ACO1O6_15975 [Bacteroidota bacterium]
MAKTWKGKKTDFLLVMLYFLIFVLVAHIGSSIRTALKHHENILDAVLSFPHFLIVLGIFILLFSPVLIYFKKIPRSFTIDVSSNKLSIDKRRKKSYNLNLDAISYFQHTFPFYSILEIYAEFDGSRGQIINKRVYTLVVPNFGLSWNRKVINEIEKTLKEANVPINRTFRLKNFWEYIYD